MNLIFVGFKNDSSYFYLQRLYLFLKFGYSFKINERENKNICLLCRENIIFILLINRLLWKLMKNDSKKVSQKFGGSKISRTFASQLRNKQTLNESKTGCSAVRLAHLLWEQGVPGSNPGTPTKQKGLELMQIVSALFLCLFLGLSICF